MNEKNAQRDDRTTGVNGGKGSSGDGGARGKIREHMDVICSENEPFGRVDRVEGDAIKLTKDDSGQHHWIPLSWVTRVDDAVHVDRPGRQAMQEWSSSDPAGARRSA